MSDSWWPNGLQHTSLLCPSFSPGVCSNSYPLSWWCYITISTTTAPFSSCLQSFPASESFPMSRLFINQNIRASASASILSMNIQNWFPLGLIGLISLQSKGLSGVFCSTTVRLHQFFGTQHSFMVQFSHLYMTTGKTLALNKQTFKGKVMSLLFNMLSSFVIAFPSKE